MKSEEKEFTQLYEGDGLIILPGHGNAFLLQRITRDSIE